jgi:hypothetical protein
VETAKGWRLTVRGKRKRRYTLQASLGTLRRPFKPCGLRAAGRPLKWTYRARVLRARFTLRRGAVTASRCR